MIKLVGATTRIPAIRSKIQSLFPTKLLSTTLKRDVLGVLLFHTPLFHWFSACAISQSVDRRGSHHGALGEEHPDKEEDTELVFFPHGNGIPSTKVLTFYRKAPFDIEAVYADPSALPGSINSWVGHLAVKDVRASPTGGCPTFRIKARLDLRGVLSFEAVYTEEVEEKEEMQVDGE